MFLLFEYVIAGWEIWHLNRVPFFQNYFEDFPFWTKLLFTSSYYLYSSLKSFFILSLERWCLHKKKNETKFGIWYNVLNPIQDGWGQKVPLPVFFPVTSTTEELPAKTFWLLVLTLLPHCCKTSSSYLVPVPYYWTWTNTTPQKSDFSGQILKKLRLW